MHVGSSSPSMFPLHGGFRLAILLWETVAKCGTPLPCEIAPASRGLEGLSGESPT